MGKENISQRTTAPLYKDIRKVKLAIATECNLGCDYCFVKKTNKKMDLSAARRAVDLLIQSKGKDKDKLLSIYGGEPLLNFGLMRKICPYAVSQAKRLNKDLTISICTNSILLTKSHLDFLEKYNIKLIISMAGDRISHNRFRKFDSNKGSYEIIVRKFPLIFKSIPLENIGVSFCIFPSLADKIEKNFKHLINLGFKYINFEIIREYECWTLNRIERFVSELNKIIKYIFSSIPKGNFIFLNPINWEIKYRTLSQSLRTCCPFNYKLEVYPRGEMAFSPFLLNSPYRNNYIIGNINEPVLKRFNSCRFDYSSNKCRRCEYDYFKNYASDEDASKVYNLYHLFCLKAAKMIKDSARKDRPFADYIQQVNKICF